MWLTSKRSDYIKDSTIGGPLEFLEFKNMSITKLYEIKFRIRNGINRDFAPRIQLIDIIVEPNYEFRFWEINIVYRSPITSKQNTAQVFIRDLSDRRKEYKRTEIAYSGDNLIEFIELELFNQPDDKLIFDPELTLFTWGKFVFTNFSVSSPNFAEVLALING